MGNGQAPREPLEDNENSFLLAKCFSYLPDDRIQALLEGKYSLESTDPCESEIRAPPQPLPYLMPIPPTRFFITKKFIAAFLSLGLGNTS